MVNDTVRRWLVSVVTRSTLWRRTTTTARCAVTVVPTAQSVSTARSSEDNVDVDPTSLDARAHTAALDTTAFLTADVRWFTVVIGGGGWRRRRRRNFLPTCFTSRHNFMVSHSFSSSTSGMMMRHGCTWAAERLKSTSSKIHNGGRCQNWKCYNCNNSVLGSPILLKYVRLVHYRTHGQSSEWLFGPLALSCSAALIATCSS